MPTIHEFTKFVAKLDGDEKSEAQTYILQLLKVFGHQHDVLPDGSRFEHRVRFPGQRIKFADFVWSDRVLIEMKSRGEKLTKHYQQTFDYWLNLVPHRPAYVVLCNFDELWVYDFNAQLQEPMDRIKVAELDAKQSALAFLRPDGGKPLFKSNVIDVTREAADKVVGVFNSLVRRGEPPEIAQRFVLQSVVSMFAEDIGLLPAGLFTNLLAECRAGASTYDLLGSLFRQMNDASPAKGGRFKGVDYFNGGLFAEIGQVELKKDELDRLFDAARSYNWKAVQPIVFGALFEGSLGKEERHAQSAHFTYEADIQRIVRPSIVKPWEERIARAKNVAELIDLLKALRNYRVLDPACGSGNFLFVAYRALREIEQKLLLRIFTQDKRLFKKMGLLTGISTTSFFGIDTNENAIEVAKVTLMLARRLAHRQADEFWDAHKDELPGLASASLQFEHDLPLDNLDQNIVCADALFTQWPKVDAIIGNPPYQSKNKMQQEFGAAYTRMVRNQFPDVPGHADFCVYWFRKSHDELKPGGRAGLVGTNTIRQNYSRIGGLDYIVANGGTITDAVSSQVWSGEAAVNVAIVNWVKGHARGMKPLFEQMGDSRSSPWQQWMLERIPSSLSAALDVTQAAKLATNAASPLCKQGQTPGNKKFLLKPDQAKRFFDADARNRDVIFPYLIGKVDVLGLAKPEPTRWVIDFAPRDLTQSAAYELPFAFVRENVLPDRQKAAGKEDNRNEELSDDDEKGNEHHNQFLERWWQLSWPRGELMLELAQIPRYIVCVRVTKRPIFEFVQSGVHPSDALTVFAAADDYTFGILQSSIHWAWFNARCSSLKRDPRYTSNTVFDSFPWPELKRSDKHRALAVAEAARQVRATRADIMRENDWSLRELYRTLDLPGANKLRTAQAELDRSVRTVFRMSGNADLLSAIYNLNQKYAAREAAQQPVQKPGLPSEFASDKRFYSSDCIKCPVLG